MQCPHCSIHFHEKWEHYQLGDAWSAKQTECPACKHTVIKLFNGRAVQTYPGYPTGTCGRQPKTVLNVPQEIAQDYEDACSVLPISAKASAALTRRCLQAVLREQGYTQKDLVKQIGAVLSETDPKKVVPQFVLGVMDVIRKFGNFSAHPITDQTTLQVIDVEPDEAQWCLEILEELFDHYYDKPAASAAKMAALNAKLTSAGKPPAH